MYLLFAAVRKLFPEHWLSGLTFPFIEDLVNGPPFYSYTRWLKEVGADWAGPCGPALAPQAVRVLQRADGQQAGELNQRAALPPLLSFGLSVDEHFEQATARLRSPMPTGAGPRPRFCSKLHSREPDKSSGFAPTCGWSSQRT